MMPALASREKKTCHANEVPVSSRDHHNLKMCVRTAGLLCFEISAHDKMAAAKHTLWALTSQVPWLKNPGRITAARSASWLTARLIALSTVCSVEAARNALHQEAMVVSETYWALKGLEVLCVDSKGFIFVVEEA